MARGRFPIARFSRTGTRIPRCTRGACGSIRGNSAARLPTWKPSSFRKWTNCPSDSCAPSTTTASSRSNLNRIRAMVSSSCWTSTPAPGDFMAWGLAAGVDFPYLLFADQFGEEVTRAGARARPDLGWLRLLTDVPVAFSDMAHGYLKIGEYWRSLRHTATEVGFFLERSAAFAGRNCPAALLDQEKVFRKGLGEFGIDAGRKKPRLAQKGNREPIDFLGCSSSARLANLESTSQRSRQQSELCFAGAPFFRALCERAGSHSDLEITAISSETDPVQD